MLRFETLAIVGFQSYDEAIVANIQSFYTPFPTTSRTVACIRSHLR